MILGKTSPPSPAALAPSPSTVTPAASAASAGSDAAAEKISVVVALESRPPPPMCRYGCGCGRRCECERCGRADKVSIEEGLVAAATAAATAAAAAAAAAASKDAEPDDGGDGVRTGNNLDPVDAWDRGRGSFALGDKVAAAVAAISFLGDVGADPEPEPEPDSRPEAATAVKVPPAAGEATATGDAATAGDTAAVEDAAATEGALADVLVEPPTFLPPTVDPPLCPSPPPPAGFADGAEGNLRGRDSFRTDDLGVIAAEAAGVICGVVVRGAVGGTVRATSGCNEGDAPSLLLLLPLPLPPLTPPAVVETPAFVGTIAEEVAAATADAMVGVLTPAAAIVLGGTATP